MVAVALSRDDPAPAYGPRTVGGPLRFKTRPVRGRLGSRGCCQLRVRRLAPVSTRTIVVGISLAADGVFGTCAVFTRTSPARRP